MPIVHSLLICQLDSHQCAFPAPTVERVLRAVAVSPLPKASNMMLGVVNVYGRVVPVIDLRRRLGLSTQELDPSQHFVIVRTAQFHLIVLVDAIVGLAEYEPNDLSAAKTVCPGVALIENGTRLPAGTLIIHDLGLLLSSEGEQSFLRALPRV
jgi:purine-binding chemotaxis protein CheW